MGSVKRGPPPKGEAKASGLAKLGDVALELAKKLDSTQAMVVLPFVAAVLVVVAVAAKPGAETALWVIAVLLVVVEVAAVWLHRVDRAARVKGLTDGDCDAVCSALARARDAVAQRLGCDPRSCRANVFGKNAVRRLQIAHRLRVNMDDRSIEWGLSIPPGRGGTGIAWKTGRPKVLVAPFEGDEDLDAAEARRVDPDLKWIISVPVHVKNRVKWVINVDGKEARERADVEAAVQDVEAVITELMPSAAKA